MSEDRLLESTNRLTGVALTESRPHVNAADLREGLRRAKIKTVRDGDLYDVLLRGNGGIYATEIKFVEDMDAIGYEVDDLVWVYIGKTGAEGETVILATGGGCDGSDFMEWGIWYGS